MKRSFWILILAAVPATLLAQTPKNSDLARWEAQARNVTIVRDDWGIAHVYGKTDADAVFGMIYAQAEDDFNRVETNYLNSMGRLAEAEGESKIYQDLRMKLFIDPAEMKKDYAASPAWLKKLMDAWAGGLNFYLAKHPDAHPRVIQKFEPWMALTFTEGSIGGDIERVSLAQLESFYGKTHVTEAPVSFEDDNEEPSGSNGIAIAPSNTVDHHSLLLINPHTSFFFRSELQMASDEGLDAYGAVTWGQFFVYQGFNDRAGWMHTSSGVNQLSFYLETIEKKDDGLFYKYGKEDRPIVAGEITIPYKAGSGMAEKKFTVYRTQHGPVVGESHGKWLTIRLMQEPIKALTQSYTRTKSKSYKEFRETLELHTNSSNNTIFADADGDIAYFHGNFIPRRDTAFDWTKPVDGSNPATDWHGLLSVDETPHLFNPKSGWLYNSNNWPWSAAGPSSPKREDFPVYVETGTESARGLHAVKVLQDKKDFSLDSLIAAAFDSYLMWFEKPIPALVKAWDVTPADNPLKAKTAEQIAALRSWDTRWGIDSVPTSLAIFWADEMQRRVGSDVRKAGVFLSDYIITKTPPDVLLQGLADASDKLAENFGSWKTPWGDINRFQRLTGDLVQPFSDSSPSIPVGFTSSFWGSLASFGARPYPGTKKWYGTSGNSFVAVVEFGEKVRARAVTAGGESGHTSSKHFDDEAQRYSTGNLREVYYYRDQLTGHTEREYHPGS
jgi:acyl-homoserine-lactone acylase